MLTPEAGRAFMEHIMFPTLARTEQLDAEKNILLGGPVVGRVARRFIVEADSTPDVDRISTSLPLWPVAETRVTPLIAFTGRRRQVQTLLESWKTTPSQK